MEKLFKTSKLNIKLVLFSLMIMFFSVIMNEAETETILLLQQQLLIP